MCCTGGAFPRPGVDGGAQGPALYGRRERKITAVCCDLAVPPLGQVWMVVRRARPPTGEENHGGMLRWGGASPWPGVDGGAQGPGFRLKTLYFVTKPYLLL